MLHKGTHKWGHILTLLYLDVREEAFNWQIVVSLAVLKVVPFVTLLP